MVAPVLTTIWIFAENSFFANTVATYLLLYLDIVQQKLTKFYQEMIGYWDDNTRLHKFVEACRKYPQVELTCLIYHRYDSET